MNTKDEDRNRLARFIIICSIAALVLFITIIAFAPKEPTPNIIVYMNGTTIVTELPDKVIASENKTGYAQVMQIVNIDPVQVPENVTLLPCTNNKTVEQYDLLYDYDYSCADLYFNAREYIYASFTDAKMVSQFHISELAKTAIVDEGKLVKSIAYTYNCEDKTLEDYSIQYYIQDDFNSTWIKRCNK